MKKRIQDVGENYFVLSLSQREGDKIRRARLKRPLGVMLVDNEDTGLLVLHKKINNLKSVSFVRINETTKLEFPSNLHSCFEKKIKKTGINLNHFNKATYFVGLIGSKLPVIFSISRTNTALVWMFLPLE